MVVSGRCSRYFDRCISIFVRFTVLEHVIHTRLVLVFEVGMPDFSQPKGQVVSGIGSTMFDLAVESYPPRTAHLIQWCSLAKISHVITSVREFQTSWNHSLPKVGVEQVVLWKDLRSAVFDQLDGLFHPFQLDLIEIHALYCLHPFVTYIAVSCCSRVHMPFPLWLPGPLSFFLFKGSLYFQKLQRVLRSSYYLAC